MNKSQLDIIKKFNLSGRVALITGGVGLLGVKHGEAIASAGGIPVFIDIKRDRVFNVARDIGKNFGVDALGVHADITLEKDWKRIVNTVIEKFGRIDILINNAANNPKVDN